MAATVIARSLDSIVIRLSWSCLGLCLIIPFTARPRTRMLSAYGGSGIIYRLEAPASVPGASMKLDRLSLFRVAPQGGKKDESQHTSCVYWNVIIPVQWHVPLLELLLLLLELPLLTLLELKLGCIRSYSEWVGVGTLLARRSISSSRSTSCTTKSPSMPVVLTTPPLVQRF